VAACFVLYLLAKKQGEITRLIETSTLSLFERIQHPTASPLVTVPPALPRGFQLLDNRLFYKGLDTLPLSQLSDEMPAPIYVRHLPSLRDNVAQLQSWFDIAKVHTGYAGDLTIAYASKANPSQPVVRTLLQAGTAYECSSNYDIEVVRHAAAQGWLNTDRTVFINGFKLPVYTRNVLQLRREGFAHIVPIFDGIEEIAPFADSGLTFDVGLRSRTDSNAEEVNRFGMDNDAMAEAADQIGLTANLRLTTFHAMQTVSASRGLQYMTAVMHSLRSYARLRRIAPTLCRFDIGGGTPARNADMDHQDWMIQLLQMINEICDQEGVPVPDLIIESGRYLVQDHAFRLFHVFKTKSAEDGIPYYMIDGSIMSLFPDAWALGDTFTVLPVNGWDGEFGAARLAGITCDHDDVYPTHRMADVPLSLPVETADLIVGFFDCGAYQETLGGRHGAKHCMLPEGPEIILDEDATGRIVVEALPAQDAACVLGSLGYRY